MFSDAHINDLQRQSGVYDEPQEEEEEEGDDE